MNFSELSFQDLRDECKERGLKAGGGRDALIDRLTNHELGHAPEKKDLPPKVKKVAGLKSSCWYGLPQFMLDNELSNIHELAQLPDSKIIEINGIGKVSIPVFRDALDTYSKAKTNGKSDILKRVLEMEKELKQIKHKL